MREQANNSIKSIYNQYKSELDAMKETVMKSKQDPKMKEAIDFLIAEWGKNKAGLTQVQNKLVTLKESC